MTTSLNLSNIYVQDMAVNTNDYPDFADAYITAAIWKDTGIQLTDSELDSLNDNSDFIYEAAIQRIF